MQPVIYDVAVSIDGYIAGPAGDISQFAHDGPVVDDYLDRMAAYSTAIMGRATYEFGFRFGLKPGQNPYPHMKTFVFSDSLILPDGSDVAVLPQSVTEALPHIRESAQGPVYLCGGGAFAGALLAADMIDRLRLKRAPVLLGGGTPLFAAGAHPATLRHVDTKTYENGYLYQEFALK